MENPPQYNSAVKELEKTSKLITSYLNKYKDEQTVSNNSGLSILGSTSTKSTSFTTIVLPNDSTLSEII